MDSAPEEASSASPFAASPPAEPLQKDAPPKKPISVWMKMVYAYAVLYTVGVIACEFYGAIRDRRLRENRAAELLVDTGERPRGPADPIVESDWREISVADVRLQSPVPLPPKGGVFEKLPPQAKEVVQSMDAFDSDDARHAFRVTVLKVQYVAGEDVPLDEVVKGMMSEAAAAVGDPTARPFQMQSRRISLLDGRLAQFVGMREGVRLHVDLAAAKEPGTVWIVQAIYVGEELRPAAERVLSSVFIAPKE